MQRLKILFIHNAITTYRAPFFKLLDEEFNIEFIFTYLEASDIIYGQDHRNTLSDLKLKDARVCKAYFSQRIPLFSEGIPLGLVAHLLTDDFDVLVDNLQSFKILLSLIGSALRRKPLILWTLQWYNFDLTFSGRLKSLVLATALKKSSAILVPGVKQREFVCQFQIDPHKVFLLPNASTIKFDEGTLQKVIKFKESYEIADKEIILYVGRLVERKGVEYLIKAFAKLRSERDDVVLVVAGDGPLKSSLQELANDLAISDSAIFLGLVDRAELPAYYCASAVCVVPSVTHAKKEPWGLVLNEAMQFGKPVIATEAVGAAHDLIKDGRNGFVIPERDEIALYEKLNLLFDDGQLRQQMGVASKKIIDEHYQYADMVKGFSAAMRYVCRDNEKKESTHSLRICG